MSARDKDTGAEQQVTIPESTNLDQGEVERMVREAEQHAEEDRRRREEIDARNELDSLAYQAEQLVTQLQDSLPVHEKARAEQLDLRRPRGDQRAGRAGPRAPADLRPAAGAAVAAGRRAGGAPPPRAATARRAETADDDEEVIDAEFTRE